MDGITFDAQFTLISIIAGLVGAVGMMLMLGTVGKAGWTRVNLITALGHLFSKHRRTAITLGTLAHLIVGVIFAILYALVIQVMGFNTPLLILAAATVMGLGHGVVASLIFVVGAEIGNADGQGEIKKAEFSGGLTYFIVHIVYGFLVGAILAIPALLGNPL